MPRSRGHRYLLLFFLFFLHDSKSDMSPMSQFKENSSLLRLLFKITHRHVPFIYCYFGFKRSSFIEWKVLHNASPLFKSP